MGLGLGLGWLWLHFTPSKPTKTWIFLWVGFLEDGLKGCRFSLLRKKPPFKKVRLGTSKSGFVFEKEFVFSWLLFQCPLNKDCLKNVYIYIVSFFSWKPCILFWGRFRQVSLGCLGGFHFGGVALLLMEPRSIDLQFICITRKILPPCFLFSLIPLPSRNDQMNDFQSFPWNLPPKELWVKFTPPPPKLPAFFF